MYNMSQMKCISDVVTEYAFQITGPSVIDECCRDTGGGRGPEKTPQ